jgi:hypothetical protein
LDLWVDFRKRCIENLILKQSKRLDRLYYRLERLAKSGVLADTIFLEFNREGGGRMKEREMGLAKNRNLNITPSKKKVRSAKTVIVNLDRSRKNGA